MKRVFEVQCSRCGKRQKVSLIPETKDYIFNVAREWSATGVPYCPECTKVISTYSTDIETVVSALIRWA